MAEDDSLPVVSVVVAYGVGTVNEKPGQAGLASVLESMMFQGSLNVGPMQHFSYLSRVGGRPDAQTREEITLFFQTIPSHQLPLVLWLESDRMMSLIISEDHLEKARLSILERLIQRRLKEAFFDSFVLFDRMIYQDFFRSHPAPGEEEDIQRLTTAAVQEFYRTYYVPNNAALCLAGNFNAARAKELIEKYFGSIPAGKEIPASPSPAVDFKGPLMQVYVDPLASSPAVHLAYRLSSPDSSDFHVFQLVDYLLIRGKSSWLPRRLLRREKIAVRLEGGLEVRKEASFFRLFFAANNEIMVDRCLRAIDSEINRLKTSLISDEELAQAKAKYSANLRSRWATTLDRAIFLAECYFSPPSLEESLVRHEKPLKVTASEIVGLANRYFNEENKAMLRVRLR